MKEYDYDIQEAFRAIENELIDSMMRNLGRHKAQEVDEELQWEQWQAKQLEALEKYRRKNPKKFNKEFADINSKIKKAVEEARKDGQTDQEAQILDRIKSGVFTPKDRPSESAAAEFFKLNDRKLDALIEATTNDFEKAEHALLRRADDQYRQIIFNAQVYANTGAGTYEKAVDMATKDFLAQGLTCITYKNGARHTIADYADMAIRTASKRAYLMGESEKREEWGIRTVIVNKRTNPCPKCLPYVGKVLIDDVYGKGSKKDGKYTLLSVAMANGFLHPRCKDAFTTYFPELDEELKKENQLTKKDVREIEKTTKEEAEAQYVDRQVEKYGRLAKYSLDKENRLRYGARAEEWEERSNSYGGYAAIDQGIDEKTIEKSHKNGTIDVEIDELVPCLKDAVTGEILDTEAKRITDKKVLEEFTQKNGWYIDWAIELNGENEVYGLFLKGDNTLQGLCSFYNDKANHAIYGNWIVAAPHNRGEGKKYIGVGGHLYAIMGMKSIEYGHDGFFWGQAKTKKHLEYYTENFGAEEIPSSKPYTFIISEQNMKEMVLSVYNFEWG